MITVRHVGISAVAAINVVNVVKCKEFDMLPLTYVKSGEIVKVVKVSGNDSAKKHMNDLGFVSGTVLQVVSSHDGDIILSVKDSRLAITKEMSERIMIDIADEKELYKSNNDMTHSKS